MPKTPEGKAALQIVSVPFQKIGEATDYLGEIAGEGMAWATNTMGITDRKSYDPMVATAVKTTLEGYLALIGSKGLKARPSDLPNIAHGGSKVPTGKKMSKAEYDKQVQVLTDAANEMGLDLGDFGLKQKLVEGAEGLNIQNMGAKLSVFRDELTKMATDAATEKNAAYTAAFNKPASFRARSLKELHLDMKRELVGFSPGLIEKSTGQLHRLEHFMKFADTMNVSEVKLRAIGQLRQELNSVKNNKATRGSPDNTAASMMVKKLDKWVDNQFDKGLISGDPGAVDALRKADKLNGIYKDRFYADKLIRAILETDGMTPETVKRTLLNLNAVNAPKQAVATVERLKQIFGKDSAEMANLRAEFLFDIATPLLKGDLNGFVTNYAKVRRNQDSLLKAIIPDSIEHYDNLARIVKGAVETLPGKGAADVNAWQIMGKSVIRGIAAFSVGHELAQKAFTMSAMRGSLEAIFGGAGTVSQKKALYKAALGIPERNKLMTPNTGKTAAVYSGIMERELENAWKEIHESQRMAKETAGHVGGFIEENLGPITPSQLTQSIFERPQ